MMWKETSAERQKEWLKATTQAVKYAKLCEEFKVPSNDDESANASRRDYRHEGDNTHHGKSPAGDDDMSVSSVEVLFHWLTCSGAEVVMPQKPKSKRYSLHGMVVSASPLNELGTLSEEQDF